MTYKDTVMYTPLILAAAAALHGCGESPDAAPAEAEPEHEMTLEEHHDELLPPAPSPGLEAGREVFVQVCARCHIESEYAPTINDARYWKQRFARADNGIDTFYDHAINGFGDMLAKGGKRGAHLTDAEVRAAVDYAVAVTQADQPIAPE